MRQLCTTNYKLDLPTRETTSKKAYRASCVPSLKDKMLPVLAALIMVHCLHATLLHGTRPKTTASAPCQRNFKSIDLKQAQ